MPYKTVELAPPHGKPGLMPLDGYIRVSRVGGRAGESYISPIKQQQTLHDRCPSGRYIARLFIEEDESGGNNLRDGWLAARQRVLDGETSGIIVVKIDRFARNTRDAIEAAEEIVDAGGRFVSCTEEIDITTPEGKYVFTQFAAIAELELARLKRGWQQAVKTVTQERHGYISGVPPTGYSMKPDSPNKGQLIPNGNAPAVAEIFLRRAAGESWTAISDYLNTTEWRPAWTPRSAQLFYERTEDAVLRRQITAVLENADEKPRSERRPWRDVAAHLTTTEHRPAWTPQTIMRIVRNPVYTGVIDRGGKPTKANGRKPDPDFAFRVEGAHEPIVPAALWSQANEVKGLHTPKDGSLTARVATKGVAVCDACGSRLQVTATRPIYGRDKGKAVPLLYCKGRSGNGRCPAPTAVTAKLLDEFVATAVKAQLRALGRAPAVEVRASKDRLDAARNELMDARQNLQDWQTPRMRASMDEQAFIEGLEELRSDVAAKEAAEEQARQEAALYEGSGGNLLELWGTFTPAELRTIYAGAIEEVRLAKPARRTNGHPPLDERVRIVWKPGRPAAASAR